VDFRSSLAGSSQNGAGLHREKRSKRGKTKMVQLRKEGVGKKVVGSDESKGNWEGPRDRSRYPTERGISQVR